MKKARQGKARGKTTRITPFMRERSRVADEFNVRGRVSLRLPSGSEHIIEKSKMPGQSASDLARRNRILDLVAGARIFEEREAKRQAMERFMRRLT